MSFPHGFHITIVTRHSNLEATTWEVFQSPTPVPTPRRQGAVEILQDGLPVLLIGDAQRELLWPAVVDEVTASWAASNGQRAADQIVVGK